MNQETPRGLFVVYVSAICIVALVIVGGAMLMYDHALTSVESAPTPQKAKGSQP